MTEDYRPLTRVSFVQSEFVDISDVHDTKIAICHENISQIAWKREVFKEAHGQSDEDYFDTFYYVARCCDL